MLNCFKMFHNIGYPVVPADLYTLNEYLLVYIVDRRTDKHIELNHFVMVVTSLNLFLFLYCTLLSFWGW